MIEQIFQGRTQQVDDEDVVKTLLTKVVHIRDTGCAGGLFESVDNRQADDDVTYGIQRGSCMSYIHPLIGEHRSSLVPGAQQSVIRRLHHSQPTGYARGGSTTYEFDGNLLIVQQVCSLKDDTKGALADLLPYSVMHTNDIR